MTLFEILKRFLKSGIKPTETPDGICPNCWGQQEYGDEFFNLVKKEGIDINTVDERSGWILEYANKYLPGIMLHETEGDMACTTCKLSYRKA